METFLIRLLQFVLAISLLVLLHEGGHMFFAKLFGVRVEKFFVFFDVNIGKWSGKLFSWKPKKDDTEYGMGWLPLGGYCKISGMIDESLDREQMKKEPQPWEFRTKPAWQRLLIMIGGVLVNFVLALFIYSMIMFTWGDSYFKVSDMTMGMLMPRLWDSKTMTLCWVQTRALSVSSLMSMAISSARLHRQSVLMCCVMVRNRALSYQEIWICYP